MSHASFFVHGTEPSKRWAVAEHTWFGRWRVSFRYDVLVIADVPGLSERDACDLAEAWGQSEDHGRDDG